MLFSVLGRGEFYTSHLSVFSPLPFVGITSLGNTPIRLNGFQMGIHHLWSSIVGYWAKITFLYFLRVFIGNWHAEHFCQTTWFRCKLNPENSGKDITRNFAIECDIIHLFPLQKGDMKICSPEKSHISPGQRPREIWLFRRWTHFHISLMQGKWMFYSTRPTFWWNLLAIFVYKIIISEHLWSYLY